MLRHLSRAAWYREVPAALAGRTSSYHPKAASKAATSASHRHETESNLQGVLGLTAGEAQSMLAEMPSLGSVKPSVLRERAEFLSCGLGISSSRLRSLVVQQPALLSDANLRDLKRMLGLDVE